MNNNNNNNNENDKVTHKSGATSSHCPRYDYIPLSALNSLAERYELGVEKHGKDNWRRGIPDVDYCLERLNHVIRHAITLQLKLQGKMSWDGDDDAGAILWGGAFATEATIYHKREQHNLKKIDEERQLLKQDISGG